MAQSAGGSSNDDGGGSAEWRHMILPAKAMEGILVIIDNLIDSTDFSDMSDEDGLQFYTGKTKPLVVRSIAQSTEPCLVFVSVLWKHLNTETSQHGNASKKSGNPSKTGFLRRFRNFCKKNGNPSKPSF